MSACAHGARIWQSVRLASLRSDWLCSTRCPSDAFPRGCRTGFLMPKAASAAAHARPGKPRDQAAACKRLGGHVAVDLGRQIAQSRGRSPAGRRPDTACARCRVDSTKSSTRSRHDPCGRRRRGVEARMPQRQQDHIAHHDESVCEQRARRHFAGRRGPRSRAVAALRRTPSASAALRPDGCAAARSTRSRRRSRCSRPPTRATDDRPSCRPRAGCADAMPIAATWATPSTN